MGSGEFSVALPRGEGINHGDTEITEGAVDRIETFGKGRDRPTTGWPEGQDERERTSQPERSGVTSQFSGFQTEDKDRLLAFASRMGRAKIRHSTCEHARVRLFYPPILTWQDFSRRSGDR